MHVCMYASVNHMYDQDPTSQCESFESFSGSHMAASEKSAWQVEARGLQEYLLQEIHPEPRNPCKERSEVERPLANKRLDF